MQNEDKEHIREKLLESTDHGIGPSIAKVVLSALEGIPVAGSIIGASITAWSAE